MGRAEPYCSQGITVRALRLAPCDELNNSARLRQAVEAAAGSGLFQSFDAALMKGQGKDLRMVGRTYSGHAATLFVDAQISPPKEEGTIDDGELSVRSNQAGATRRVTVAPAAWSITRATRVRPRMRLRSSRSWTWSAPRAARL